MSNDKSVLDGLDCCKLGFKVHYYELTVYVLEHFFQLQKYTRGTVWLIYEFGSSVKNVTIRIHGIAK